MRINLSFKNTEKEKKLFDTACSYSDKSAYIKRCMQFYEDNKIKSERNEEDTIIDADLSDILI